MIITFLQIVLDALSMCTNIIDRMEGGLMPVDRDAEHLEIRKLARDVARERYAPRAEEWDVGRIRFPQDERRYLGSLGFLGMALPEEFGGAGSSLLEALIVIEELAKECRPAAFQAFEANTGPAQVVNLLGTDAQRARYLPEIIRGDATMDVAISEPDAGSAATDMTTRAKLADGAYTVNGSKRWISNSSEADYYLVYARMSDAPGAKGIGAIIVEKDRDRVSFGAQERLMGFRGIPSADIYFDDVTVPEENLLIGAGGFRKLFTAFSIERMGNATMSLAIGQTALDRTVDYVQA